MPIDPSSSLPERVLLVGAGRVGTAAVHLLARSGVEVVGVASRTPGSAKDAAAFLNAPVSDLDALPAADLVVIGSVDGGIARLAERVAASASAQARVVHLSGVSGVPPLKAITETGGIAWALHPVQACPDIQTAIERLPGSAWGVTASADLEGAMHLVRDGWGGAPLEVAEEDRPRWHAASVMTSNGISALMAFGEEILSSIGVNEPAEVLGPLATGSVANARSGGGGSRTLTGPVVRGEAETIGKHLTAFDGEPALRDRYRAVARMILEAAQGSDRLELAARRAIEDLL